MHYSRTCASALNKNGGGRVPESHILKAGLAGGGVEFFI